MILLVLLVTLLNRIAPAQINLEHDYPASVGLTKLSLSGYKYFLMDVTNNVCTLYNMDHSLWKTIALTVPSGMYLYDVKFVSETLFNSDSKVELAYIYYSYDATLQYYTYYTRIINENGNELLSIPGCAYLEIKEPVGFGTKMLAYVYDYSITLWTVNTQVFSLPGTLAGEDDAPISGKDDRHAFPNPAGSSVTIPFQLPEGTRSGEILLMNQSGQLIRTYRIDCTFHDLQISLAGFPRGIYLYQVKTDREVVSSGRLIHD